MKKLDYHTWMREHRKALRMSYHKAVKACQVFQSFEDWSRDLYQAYSEYGELVGA